MNLSNFSAKDFLLNESFQRWVLEPDDDTKSFWETWMTKHPEKYETICEARMQIETMNHFFARVNNKHAEEVWGKISNSIEEADLETLKK